MKMVAAVAASEHSAMMIEIGHGASERTIRGQAKAKISCNIAATTPIGHVSDERLAAPANRATATSPHNKTLILNLCFLTVMCLHLRVHMQGSSDSFFIL